MPYHRISISKACESPICVYCIDLCYSHMAVKSFRGIEVTAPKNNYGCQIHVNFPVGFHFEEIYSSILFVGAHVAVLFGAHLATDPEALMSARKRSGAALIAWKAATRSSTHGMPQLPLCSHDQVQLSMHGEHDWWHRKGHREWEQRTCPRQHVSGFHKEKTIPGGCKESGGLERDNDVLPRRLKDKVHNRCHHGRTFGKCDYRFQGVCHRLLYMRYV